MAATEANCESMLKVLLREHGWAMVLRLLARIKDEEDRQKEETHG